MGLLMISETINDICKVSHSFSNEEKEFIVQFAFKTSDKELTNKLIDELVESVDETDSIRIMEKYSVMYDVKPTWVSQIENLLVSIEMYRIQEQKAITRLSEVLGAYGIDVSEDEVRTADSESIKAKIAESQRETEEQEEEEVEKKSAESEPKCTLREPVL